MTCLPKHRITGLALAFDFSWSIIWWKSSTFIWFFLDVTKNNKRSKLKDISTAACHIILPSLLLTKIIQEFCDLFYPLGNNFYELSILPVLLNLLLDLRTHFKASNRKNFNFFSSGRLKNVKEVKDWLHRAQQSAEDIFIWNAWAFRYWFQASLRKTNMAAEVNFFYAHVEKRLPIWSPGPSVHLIGKSLCLKLHVYTRYHCIHETLSFNHFPALWFDFATAR